MWDGVLGLINTGIEKVDMQFEVGPAPLWGRVFCAHHTSTTI